MTALRTTSRLPKGLLYQNTALTASKRDIRLLEILPGNESTAIPLEKSQVQCKISVVSLDKTPKYEALSYVWGSEEHLLPISVDGHDFPVTRNLKEALRYLRHKSQPVKMWVDAVCINQEDGHEKSWQLAMMKNIYEQANTVQVFLGPGKDSSESSIAKLLDIGAEAFDTKLSSLTLDDIARGIEPSPGDPQSAIKESFVAMSKRIGEDLPFAAWVEFTNCPYWKRLWIFQEFCLGQQLLIYYGHKEISFQVFAALFRFLDLHKARVASTVSPGKINTQDPWALTEGRKALALINSFEVPNSLAVASLIGGRHWHQSGSTGITLLQLLQRCCVVGTSMSNRAAKYPRDLIYGLLGLASDAKELNIVPRYENKESDEETEEIFVDTARKLLENGNADILAWSQTPKRFSGLPSWAPDFTFIRLPVCDSTQTAFFSASGNTELHAEPVPGSSRAIGIRGIRVDTIKSLGSLWDPKNGLESPSAQKTKMQVPGAPSVDETASNKTSKEESIEEYLLTIKDFCEQSETMYSGRTPRDTQRWKEEAYWRIPCADQSQGITDRVRASPEAKKGYEDLLRSFVLNAESKNITIPEISFTPAEGQSMADLQASISRITVDFQARLAKLTLDCQACLSPERGAYTRALSYLHNRRPFISEMGYVGLAPGQAKVGDLVVLFHGAIQPFVLTDSKSKEGFELLGEAYVHEIMAGELLKEEHNAELFTLN